MGKTTEVILCDACNGKGYRMAPDPKDMSEGVKVGCHRCNSSGRLRVTTTIEVEPYQ